MQTLQAVIMGTFQGLTEFLPVSSSGHIVITSALYKLFAGASTDVVGQEEIFFDILIHLATLFAVIIYFWSDLKNITKGFLKSVFEKNYSTPEFKMGAYIICATFVTCVMGLFIKDIAHELTENPFLVSIFIMVTGCILFLSEKFKKKDKPLNLKTALWAGLFQGLAIFPGISRSGMTISSLVFLGTERVLAARFSFLLSVPIILLASFVYPLMSFDLSEVKNFNFSAIFWGMTAAFVVGFVCIKCFMKFLEKHGLLGFAIYCFIMGGASACIFYFN